MSAFINTSPATGSKEEACIFTYAAERKEKNVMEALTGGVRSEIVCRQTSGLILLKNDPESVIRRQMPIIGRRGGAVLVTSVERKSRFSVIALAPDKRADSVTQALAGALVLYQEQVHTITCDNGKEFSFHEEFSAALQAECFFAHPYQAQERGLNENTNGLIRQYLPKGTDFDMLSQQDINLIMDNLNNRPRKSLSFNTPKKLFLGACQKVALGT